MLTCSLLSLFKQKLRDAGIEVPESGKKGPGPQEENKTLKAEVKTLKEELETTKKGEEEREVMGKREQIRREVRWSRRYKTCMIAPSLPAST